MSKRAAGNGSHYYKGYKQNGPPAKKQQRQYQPRAVWKPETKYFDTAVDGHTIATANDWTGTEVPCDQRINEDGATITAYTASTLNPSAIGTGYGQVIGTKYNIKKMRIKGVLKVQAVADQADVPTSAVVRVVLVQDINAAGTQAQGENVFTDFGGDTVNVNSYLNMGTNAGKFRILKDMRVLLQPAVAGTDGASTNSTVIESSLFHMEWTPKKPLLVNLRGPTATPQTSQISTSNIFLLALTDAVNTVAISCCSRCYFCE